MHFTESRVNFSNERLQRENQQIELQNTLPVYFAPHSKHFSKRFFFALLHLRIVL